MNISVNGAFVYFTIPIFGGIPITQTTVSGLVVTVILCLASVFLGRNLSKRPGRLQVMVEKGVMMAKTMVIETMGPHNVSWTPFIAVVFLNCLLGSYIGLSGFLRSTTADLSTTLTWAVTVSVIIWYNNIKNNGFLGWLRGFTEPIAVMTPMNIVSEIAQPVAMAFRQFGNVAGGGVITALIYSSLTAASTALIGLISANGWLMSAIMVALGLVFLVLWARKKKVVFLVFGILFAVMGVLGVLQATNVLSGVPILALGIPAVLSCYFDLFSGFIQAYVFTLLTMVYISGSLPEPEQV